jgi:hypothetical protein
MEWELEVEGYRPEKESLMNTVLGTAPPVPAPAPIADDLDARMIDVEKVKLEAQRQHDAAAEAAAAARARRADAAREHALTGRAARALDKADGELTAAEAALARAAERVNLLDGELSAIARQKLAQAEADRRRCVGDAARAREQAAVMVDQALGTLLHRVTLLLERHDALLRLAPHMGLHLGSTPNAIFAVVRGELRSTGLVTDTPGVSPVEYDMWRSGRPLAKVICDAEEVARIDPIERRRQSGQHEGDA